MSGTQLPEWQCHKRVRAAQIEEIKDLEGWGQRLKLAGGVCVDVDSAWVARHTACVGGYYVVYEDGYVSFSPRAAFEGGYTKIIEGA